MIKKIDERIVWNRLKSGEEPPSIRLVPALVHLTYSEFKQLVNSYNSGVSLFPDDSSLDGGTSNPQHPKEETLNEYFEHNKKIKSDYPVISFRVSKELKKRWIDFVESQTSGRYYCQKQTPYLIEMLKEYLDEHSPEVEQ